MAEVLHDTIAEGRGSLRLSLDVAREGLAARLAPPDVRRGLAWVLLGLCSIPLFPQGLVPAIMKLTETPTRSWFLALYLPDGLQWPAIGAFLVLGIGMLRGGLRLARTCPPPQRC